MPDLYLLRVILIVLSSVQRTVFVEPWVKTTDWECQLLALKGLFGREALSGLWFLLRDCSVGFTHGSIKTVRWTEDKREAIHHIQASISPALSIPNLTIMQGRAD